MAGTVEAKLSSLIQASVPELDRALHSAAHKAGVKIGELIGQVISEPFIQAVEQPLEDGRCDDIVAIVSIMIYIYIFDDSQVFFLGL